MTSPSKSVSSFLSPESLLKPDWKAPAGVQAVGTVRSGGVSPGKYESLNLGAHVGDDNVHVLENRRRFLSVLQGVKQLYFVNQVHGTDAVLVSEGFRGGGAASSKSSRLTEEPQVHENQLVSAELPQADAMVTKTKGLGLVILTADCLPVFCVSSDGLLVGVAHAGWRGLAGGILENTVTLMRQEARANGSSETIMAAFGPAIGPMKFEVGEEVRAAFMEKKSSLAELFFKPGASSGKYLANLYGLASLRLGLVDVQVTGQCRRCTVSEPDQFFSYRRDGQTGRQASVIWIS
jgi:polyphenol oxidase